MKSHEPEIALLMLVILVSIGGFWKLFMGPEDVMMTFELALLIVLAFALRKNRNLHGAFLMSSSLMFLGIALFFSLLGFVPQFRIEGPETFYRFGTAAAAAGLVIAVPGTAFFLRNRRHGWPWLLVGLVFFINEAINALMRKYGGLQPLTEFVGSFNENQTFGVALVLFLALLSFAWYAGEGKAAFAGARPRLDMQ